MTLHINDPARLEAVSVVKPVPVVRHSGLSLYRDFGKRALDIAIVLLTAPITLPLFLLLSLMVAIDGQPPFYVQKRVGRYGHVFGMLKFRTMVCDADQALQAHLNDDPKARAEWNRDQKLKMDPRITRVGRILRKTSMDELPQIWNVLKGEMSLVGPRPMMVDQVALYPGEAYYQMRPGISGLWQVSDRNDTTFADRAIYDDTYYEHLSPVTDLIIIAQTFIVVLRGTGY